jgi:hypothetical protein
MIYPGDPDKRALLLLSELLKCGTDEVSRDSKQLRPADQDALNSLDLALYRNISQNGRVPIRDEAAERLAQGAVVARVLLFALRCGMHAPEHRSLSKAIHVIADLSPRAGLPVSVGSIKNYWREYRRVSHLHAAFLLAESDGWGPFSFDENGQQENFLNFLWLAYDLKTRAENQTSPLGRTSTKSDDSRHLLDGAWWPPGVMVAPLGFFLPLPPLSSKETDALRRYGEHKLG